MVVCPNCGEENPDKFRLCGFCGTPLRAQTAPPQEARKTVTVLFCDLVGSTALGERLDSESLREVMDRYFAEMKRIVERHGGIVEKYIGDAVMAVFGLPRVHEDDALRAVRAVWEMKHVLGELNRELHNGWGVSLVNRTGVHTGEVVVGDAASGQRLATGDAVNVAARLEQAAPHGGVLLGGDTYRLVRDAVEVEAIEPLSLKGKARRVQALHLLDVRKGEGVRRRLDAPMVGRQAELGRLLEAFQDTTSAQTCEVVTVMADPGLGKTRLLKELERAVTGEAEVVVGGCPPYGATSFWPLAEVLNGLTGLSADNPPETVVRKLSSLLDRDDADDLVESVFSLLGTGGRVLPLEEGMWAAREFLTTFAERRPLVVVFEDVHWAQPTFLDFIEFLVARPSGASLLLVCSARPELYDHRPGWMNERDNATMLQLDALDAGESDMLVASSPGSASLTPEAKRRVVEAAEGNPLFVEQLVAMWVDPDAGEEMAARPIPPTISALLSARLDLLPPEQRALTAVGSVVGQVFYEGAVRDLEANRDASFEQSIDALMAKMFIRSSTSDLVDEVAYAFRHALIRDAAYRGLLKRARASLHERFATWLTRKVAHAVGEMPEQTWSSALQDAPTDIQAMVGYHLEQAHTHLTELARTDDHTRLIGREAGLLLARSGRTARDQEDIPSAVSFLKRAAVLLREMGSERLDLLVDLGKALFEGGHFDEANQVLDEAATFADACRDERLSARLNTIRLLVRRETHPHGWVREVRATGPDIVARLERCSDDAGLASIWIVISYA
ncbi:MAG: adenylate/guanylate cyclase domain-containing protein, partial [Actinomycetota bacterium]